MTALPVRSDLRNGRQRVIARLALGALNRSEAFRARFLPPIPLPADDHFYRQPELLERRQPGELLDIRPITARGLRRPVNADARRIRFRSTGMQHEPIAGCTTLLIPRQTPPGGRRPLLSYQPAIDSLSPTADPSYALRNGSFWELPVARAALRRGWAVLLTDYNGPNQAFGALPLAGRFILDAARAALSSEHGGLDATTPIGLWGYSGGAQATLWAAEQHSAYAPELNLAAVAAGGAGVDLVSSPEMYDGGNFLAGIPFGSVVGLSRAFPDIDLSVFTSHGMAMLEAAADMRAEQLMLSFAFVRLSDHLTVPGLFDIPGMRAALEAIRLGKATPSAPTYLYHAIRDQYTPIVDVDKLVDTYRSDGLDVTYRRYRLGKHNIVAIAGARSALNFLRDRIENPLAPRSSAAPADQ
jgi:hypothetical protein